MAAVLERKPRAKNSRNSKVLLQPNGRTTRIPRPKTTPPAATEKLLTAEEYWATCDIENTELIDGKVVELMPPGFDHGEIAIIIGSVLRAFVKKHKLGRVSAEGGFTIRRNPDSVRGPDIGYASNERLGEQSTHAFIEGAPTLAVEVVSPGDTYSEVEKKVLLYLETGTQAVWIVDPKTATVTVREGKTSRVYNKASTLSGDPVLPGFKLPLKEVFDI